MKHYLLLLLWCPLLGTAQTDLNAFKAFADSAGLVFEMPQGYTAVAVKENPDLWYSFAIINADKSMEVRYTIWSLQPMIEAYKASLKDTTTMMIHPNSHYTGRVQANVLNMTGGIDYNIGAFPPQAVRKEFNATAGGSCFFEFNCVFGEGYRYGQMMYLHKDDTADVIVTFMSNDQSRHADLMRIPFHALKFKE